MFQVLDGPAVVIFGVYQYWANRSERRAAEKSAAELARKAANYQAWQVVNTAQGKGGSGGRNDVLKDLTVNGVSLAGVNLDGAWLEAADLSDAKLLRASLVRTNLQGAQLIRADLSQADLTDANLRAANLREAALASVKLAGAQLSAADLEGADLGGIVGWESIESISYTNIRAVRNAPRGFCEWALGHGAQDSDVQDESEELRTFSSDWRAV